MRLLAAAGAALMIAIGSLTSVSATRPHVPMLVNNDEFRPVPAPTAQPSRVATVILDPAPLATPRPTRPAIGPIPTPRLVVVSVAATAPPKAQRASGGGGAHSLTGASSWYCEAGVSSCMAAHPDTAGFDAYAAAGPALRIAMGGGARTDAPDPWRGRIVTVSANGRSVRVTLSDFCQCYRGQPQEKIIDLYHDVWVALGIPGGSNRVTIRW